MTMPSPYEFERILNLQRLAIADITDEQLWDIARYGSKLDYIVLVTPMQAAREFWRRCHLQMLGHAVTNE